VLCNGIGASLEVLDPLVDQLDPDTTVVRFDVPGVGGSPNSTLPYTFPYLAAVVGRLMSALGLGGEGVDVLGLSWGGALAQQFAFQNPRRCRRLILVSTGVGIGMVPARPAVLAKMLTPAAIYGSRLCGPGSPVNSYGGGARADGSLVQRLFDRQLMAASPVVYAHQLLAASVWSSLFALPLIRQPTLIVAGTDDPIIPVANAGSWPTAAARDDAIYTPAGTSTQSPIRGICATHRIFQKRRVRVSSRRAFCGEAVVMRAMTVVPGCKGTAAVETLDEPPDAQGELLVSGRLVGVCGTDREIAEGVYGEPPQGESRLVLGHEGLGEVLEAPVGSGFERGDLVVGIVRRPDPVTCPACAAGQWDMCRNGPVIERGIVRGHGYGSERWRVEPRFAVSLRASSGTWVCCWSRPRYWPRRGIRSSRSRIARSFLAAEVWWRSGADRFIGLSFGCPARL